jgi:hypothetical protein
LTPSDDGWTFVLRRRLGYHSAMAPLSSFGADLGAFA